MGDIKTFSVISTTPATSQEIVEILEAMLEEAKSGHLTGLAYAYSTREGQCLTGWESMAGHENTMAVAIMQLFYRYGQESTGT
jgi:hypothetical protein